MLIRQGITLDDTKSPQTPTQDEQFVFGVAAEGEVEMTEEAVPPAESSSPGFESSSPAPAVLPGKSRSKRHRSSTPSR